MAQSMRALHQRGYRLFDLSIGDLPYKRDFGVAEVPLFDLDVASSWRAMPVLACGRMVTSLKRSAMTGILVRSMRRGWPRGSRGLPLGMSRADGARPVRQAPTILWKPGRRKALTRRACQSGPGSVANERAYSAVHRQRSSQARLIGSS